jgi:hypothetical protein
MDLEHNSTTGAHTSITMSGSLTVKLTSASASMTAAGEVVILMNDGGTNRTITLPALAGITGRIYSIKKTNSSAATVTIDANSTELIDGVQTLVISAQYHAYVLCAAGQWQIIAEYQPFIGCRVFNNGIVTIPNNVDTAVAFDNESSDSDTMHDNAVNPTRITFRTDGKYAIWAQLQFDNNSTGRREIRIRRNGTAIVLQRIENALSATVHPIQVSHMAEFVNGDYVEVLAFQNSGGNLNIAAAQAVFMVSYQGR